MKPIFLPNELSNYDILYENALKELLEGHQGNNYNLWKRKIISNRGDENILLSLGWDIKYNPLIIEDINISKKIFNKKIENKFIINENVNKVITIKKDYNPIYLVITGNNSLFAKGIKKVTNSKYSHASISFNKTLNNLYSFGTDKDGKFGFAIENKKNNFNTKKYDSDLLLYCILLLNKQLQIIKNRIDYIVKNKEKFSYSMLGIFGFMINKNINIENKMFCSQFVDSIFKLIGCDLTNKPSGLVSPSDLSNINENKKTIFKLYEGKMSNYNYNKLNIKKD